MLGDFDFVYYYLLYLLFLVPAIVYWYIKKHSVRTSEILYPSLQVFKGIKPTIKERLVHVPFILRVLAVTLLIIAAARPQSYSTGEDIYTEGIEIVMVLDISSSMLAEDFKPNRLEAAKTVTEAFISGRKTDKIGLVIFAAESFTQCPLTIDYHVLKNLLKTVKSGMIEDGTAIGTAIGNGINRLKDSEAKSKVMILLTDGVNNRGEIDPVTAAQLAAEYGIRIYTIGVGSRGEAPYPFQTQFGVRYQMVPVEIDTEVLSKIALDTGGKYFRATNNTDLTQVYKHIDSLEKTKVGVTSYRKATELFYFFAGLALILILLEVILGNTYLRRLP